MPEKLTSAQREEYRHKFAYRIPAVGDADGKLVSDAQAVTTPEAAVFLGERLMYHGRIDNRYVSLGQARARATEHDLDIVLNALQARKPVPYASRPAIGCAIADLAGVTFNHDIAPILYQNCAPCHRPGEVAPFSLLSYQDARLHASQTQAAKISSGRDRALQPGRALPVAKPQCASDRTVPVSASGRPFSSSSPQCAG